jgi:hypothetical protein
LVASFSSGEAKNLAIYEDDLFVADGVDGLLSLSIATPTSPTLCDSIPFQVARDVAVSGGYVYVNDEEFIRVVDADTINDIYQIGLIQAGQLASGVPQGTVWRALCLATANRIWMGSGTLGAFHSSLLQEGAKPSIVAESIVSTHHPVAGTDSTKLEFKWRTEEWTDPCLDRVTIKDYEGNDEECEHFPDWTTIGMQTEDVELVQVRPAKEGGYLHRMIYRGIECYPGCKYDYKVKSAIVDDQAMEVSSGQYTLRIRVCASP